MSGILVPGEAFPWNLFLLDVFPVWIFLCVVIKNGLGGETGGKSL